MSLIHIPTQVSMGAALLWTLLAFNWILGIVIAQGFWSTSISSCFPPYAWYLVVEYFFEIYKA